MLYIPALAHRPQAATLASQVGWPLFDTQATRTLEQRLAATGCEPTLMQRAGQALARLALALAPHARTVWIACGPGNNGGDGLQAAAWLARWHAAQPGPMACRVLVTCTRERGHMPADAQSAWDAATQAGVQWTDTMPEDMGAQDLCLDALLGIGLQSRSSQARPDPRLLALMQALQASPCPVLCVDIASGLDADSGQFLPQFTPRHGARAARHTLALLTLQPGLFTGAGRDACGQIWWDDLGCGLQQGVDPAGPTACAHLFTPPPDEGQERPHASHKGSFGDVAVLGGEGLALRGMSMVGAAWLAALAALHAGAGRVMLSLLDENAPPGQTGPAWPEIMLRSPEAQDWRTATVVCGCGGGLAVRPWMAQVLEQAPRLVLDADGLNAVADDPALGRMLGSREQQGLQTVLTPHPLEAAHLLGCCTADVQSRRLDAARELAQRFQCTALLKGSGTVIASRTGLAQGVRPTCWINPTGNARLATGGTGDVLAGLIAALWAQGRTAPEAAALAAHRHGSVAEQWPRTRPFSASALAVHLGQG